MRCEQKRLPRLVGSRLCTHSLEFSLSSCNKKQQCRRQKKKLDAKLKSEQKALYQQYYEDVYSLQIQNAELIAALEQLGYKVG